jgi:tRNA dimethylallyltransferase
MIESGFVEEVDGLLAQGVTPDLSSMSAIGYRQIAEYLNGECTLEEAVEEIKKVTRKFYRRQMTWFKLNDPKIHWFEMGENVEPRVHALIKEFLSS